MDFFIRLQWNAGPRFYRPRLSLHCLRERSIKIDFHGMDCFAGCADSVPPDSDLTGTCTSMMMQQRAVCISTRHSFCPDPLLPSEGRSILEPDLDRPFPLGTMIHPPLLDPLDQISDSLLSTDSVNPLFQVPKRTQLFGEDVSNKREVGKVGRGEGKLNGAVKFSRMSGSEGYPSHIWRADWVSIW